MMGKSAGDKSQLMTGYLLFVTEKVSGHVKIML